MCQHLESTCALVDEDSATAEDLADSSPHQFDLMVDSIVSGTLSQLARSEPLLLQGRLRPVDGYVFARAAMDSPWGPLDCVLVGESTDELLAASGPLLPEPALETVDNTDVPTTECIDARGLTQVSTARFDAGLPTRIWTSLTPEAPKPGEYPFEVQDYYAE